MEIGDDHVDYAVVDRFRKMLVGPPATAYDVSLSYALFCSILCWSMQHIRIDQQSHGFREDADKRAMGVAGALRTESASALPWRCELTSSTEPNGKQKKDLSTNDQYFELSAFGLLKMLRDAISHGDKRNVTPFHSQDRHGKRILQGFDLRLEWKRNEKFGTARLLHADIVRMGSKLAQQYCDALMAAGDSHLAEDAERGVLETPASRKAALCQAARGVTSRAIVSPSARSAASRS